MSHELPKFRRGDVLKADDLNVIVDAIASSGLIRGGPGLSVRRSSGGTQITSVAGAYRAIGVASGNIAARSGTTPGSGTVTVKWYDGSALADAGDSVSVLYGSSKTMTSGHGIDSGQYVWVEEDIYGQLWVSPLECS